MNKEKEVVAIVILTPILPLLALAEVSWRISWQPPKAHPLKTAYLCQTKVGINHPWKHG